MGLKNTIKNAVGVAFAVTEDLQETFTFEMRTPEGAYNPQTGTRAVSVSRFDLKGIKADRPSRAIEGGTATDGDLTLLIQTTILSEQVRVNTEVTDMNGNKWWVAGIDRDPADATIEFLLRRRS